jgi:hypothetical protein
MELNNFVLGFVSRDVKKLYLGFLYVLEDLRDQNKIDEQEFERLRKRVLDHGNNCYRNIEEQLNTFDFKIKQ